MILAVGAAAMVAPFLWQLVTSLQTTGETTSVPPHFLPSWQWSNYSQVFHDTKFAQQFLNSVLQTVVRVLAQVLFCSMAAYAFARLRFPGRNALFLVMLAVLMVPSQVYLLPQYQLVQNLGLLNTLSGVVLPGLFSAFGTFMLRQFFMSLPQRGRGGGAPGRRRHLPDLLVGDAAAGQARADLDGRTHGAVVVERPAVAAGRGERRPPRCRSPWACPRSRASTSPSTRC